MQRCGEGGSSGRGGAEGEGVGAVGTAGQTPPPMGPLAEQTHQPKTPVWVFLDLWFSRAFTARLAGGGFV